MFTRKSTSPALGAVLLAAASLAVGACSETVLTGPSGLSQVGAFDEISLSAFEQMLSANDGSMQITLGSSGMTAGEVALAPADGSGDHERIDSHVTGVQLNRDAGTLLLELGSLSVSFDAHTRFRSKTGDDLSLAAFIERLEAALAEGDVAAVRALRLVTDHPRSPDDASFFAVELRLLTGEGPFEIEMLVNRDNFIPNDNPPPDGWIKVLDLLIEVSVSDGRTRLEEKRSDPDADFVDFEGRIRSVDLEQHSFTLGDGTVVYLAEDTRIKFERGDEHRLPSLAAVAEAVRSGKEVFTAGEAMVRGREPLTLVAIHVVFEVEPPPLEDFRGIVRSVNESEHTVTLADGIVVRLTEDTRIKFEEGSPHHLRTLGAVAEALRTGETVFAAGEGRVVGIEPLAIVAKWAVFEVEGPPVEDFEGVVESVDPAAHTATLTNGLTLQLTGDSHIKYEPGDSRRLPSLETVAEALRNGETVVAHGAGTVEETASSRTIVAHWVVFEVENTVTPAPVPE